MAQENEFIEVSILNHFNIGNIPIGTVKIKKSFFPEKPDWLLSLGYRILKIADNKIEKYEVICFGLISDLEYINYKEE